MSNICIYIKMPHLTPWSIVWFILTLLIEENKIHSTAQSGGLHLLKFLGHAIFTFVFILDGENIECTLFLTASPKRANISACIRTVGLLQTSRSIKLCTATAAWNGTEHTQTWLCRMWSQSFAQSHQYKKIQETAYN